MKVALNPIQQMSAEVERLIPGVEVKIRQPKNADGCWWLDAKVPGQWVTVQWTIRSKAGVGFGITARDDVAYGVGCDEVVIDQAAALARVLYLLRSKEKTVDPCP